MNDAFLKTPANAQKSISGESIAELLGAERMERVVCLESTPSTNDCVRDMALRGAPAGTVVIADSQTAGRGRMGRTFFSPPCEGIYLSMLLRPDCSAECASRLTAWAGVAVCRALSGMGVQAGIKWVNDIVMNGRKLGGILTEASIGDGGRVGHVVVGVGLNAAQCSFPPELCGVATSLYAETGRQFSRTELASALIRELDAAAVDFPGKKAEYLAYYRARCVTLGREVTFAGGDGTAVGIDEDFGLVVRRPDGAAETLRSGEVSVRGLYGYV